MSFLKSSQMPKFSQTLECRFKLRFLSRVENFLLSWELYPEFIIFSLIEIFIVSWKTYPEFRVFSWVEKFSPKLITSFLTWEFFFSLSVKIFFPSGYEQNPRKEKKFKIFDSLRSFCLVLWARSLYSLEYKDKYKE